MASGDEPPNSRLFILCGKGITEQVMRENFSKFGTVEDVWIVKDRRTNEEKGTEVCNRCFSSTQIKFLNSNLISIPRNPVPRNFFIVFFE